MALYTSYNQIGRAEDVSDIISNLSPTKTPFISSIGDEKVTARLFEWQEDSLASVAVNAQLEGFTAADATLTPTTMRNNVVQIFQKTIKVATMADAIKTYGRAKETAYQLSKAMEEVKRDLEHAMVGVTQAAVAGSAGVARQFASVDSQIDASTTTAGGTAALTEAMILSNQQATYAAGADPSILMVKPADSLIISNFANSTSRPRDIGDGTKLVNSIKVYVTPFGELKVVLNRFIKSTNALLYDPSNWKKAVLRPWSREALAKTGDNETHMIVGEFSLKHVNFKASGLINALT
jgi:Family of unknown function (DUF5309)